MRKTAHNYDLGRCCNYDLKRWRAHGDGGASNSEARRKVLRWLMVVVRRRELQRKWQGF